MPGKRNYESETRARAKARTREAIIRAVIAVILDDGVHAFTMQNVATKANVSLRTVYRHFASRELLLEGLSDHLDDAMRALGFSAPTGVEELAAVGPALYRRFDSIRDAMKASVIASIATGYRASGHLKRWAALSNTVARAYPHLDPEELSDASAIIGALSGSRTWYVLTAELGLSPEQGGRALAWALGTLLEDLGKRNAAAQPTPGTGGPNGIAADVA